MTTTAALSYEIGSWLPALLRRNSGASELSLRAGSVDEHVVRMSRDLLALHEQRHRLLSESSESALATITATLDRAVQNINRYDIETKSRCHGLERQLVALTLRGYAILERQSLISNRQLAAEMLECDRRQAQVKASARLQLFGLHLENETSGQVKFKRLPPQSPQCTRCKRAACENVKKDFFGPSSRFVGLEVLDVFKVEHALLLERFHARLAAMENSKVKGLFCLVPAERLERMIAYGMAPCRQGRGTRGGASVPGAKGQAGASAGGMSREEVFRTAWFGVQSTSQDDARGRGGARAASLSSDGSHRAGPEPRAFAEKAVWGSPGMAELFPVNFSRFSTLEQHRAFTRTGHVRAAGETAAAGAPNEGAGGDQGENGQSDVFYLVLCRVALGNLFVTSHTYRGFPELSDKGLAGSAFDTMYSPGLEEYLAHNPETVLPEFVLQFHYLNQKPASSSLGPGQGGQNGPTGQVEEGAEIIPVHLSPKARKAGSRSSRSGDDLYAHAHAPAAISGSMIIGDNDGREFARHRRKHRHAAARQRRGLHGQSSHKSVRSAGGGGGVGSGVEGSTAAANAGLAAQSRAAPYPAGVLVRPRSPAGGKSVDETAEHRADESWDALQRAAGVQFSEVISEVDAAFEALHTRLRTLWQRRCEHIGPPPIIVRREELRAEFAGLEAELSKLRSSNLRERVRGGGGGGSRRSQQKLY